MNYSEYNRPNVVDHTPNGRVVGLRDQPSVSLPLYEDKIDNKSYNCQVIQGLHQESPINQAFFSRENVDCINNQIVREIYRVSGGKYKISKQSETELVIVMRGMYFQFGQNLNYDIDRQIADLNKKVIEYAVPKIRTEIEQYLGYLNEVENLPNQIEHPKNMSNKGTRTLPSVTTTF